MQLIQIGQQQPAPTTVTIREMFEQLAQQEAEYIRDARERVQALSASGTSKSSH